MAPPHSEGVSNVADLTARPMSTTSPKILYQAVRIWRNVHAKVAQIFVAVPDLGCQPGFNCRVADSRVL
jgi:hypothetical protein